MLEKLERVSYLYDIYGFFLTSKQQQALQLYYFDNLSLGEIAEIQRISRQGVYDLVKRALQSLETMEGSMKLYERYVYRKKKLNDMMEIISALELEIRGKEINRLRKIVKELFAENEN